MEFCLDKDTKLQTAIIFQPELKHRIKKKNLFQLTDLIKSYCA